MPSFNQEEKTKQLLLKTINYSMCSFAFIALDIQCFKEGIQLSVKNFGFQVFLDDLPADFSDALLEYNRQVTEDFASFLLIVSRLADMKQEYQLPLSKIGKCILVPL